MVAILIVIMECNMLTRANLLDIFSREPNEDDYGGAAWQGWTPPKDSFPKKITGKFWPEYSSIFSALERISPENVNYVILGKDPYPQDNLGRPYATGIAFEVNDEISVIPSALKRLIRNIYTEKSKRAEIELWIRSGDSQAVNAALNDWMSVHGVLMLNSALTVPQVKNGEAIRSADFDHISIWSSFTTSIVAQIIMEYPKTKIIAWGGEARAIICNAFEIANKFTHAYHPSWNPNRNHLNLEKDFDNFWKCSEVGKQLTLPPRG